MQWLASGVLEWVRKLLWSADTPWQTLIDEAQGILTPWAPGGIACASSISVCHGVSALHSSLRTHSSTPEASHCIPGL